ncbi:DUF1853 family protein [Vibrio hannami]|uniref:DUF1853 family protein n=1 Tax=Vibrio hannami TaxID=2717094 RepID=UPI00241089E3|nr:DUF1853 family protein [Vibrio hannami]MDG3087451.1 DUF1853 family protein [Vibrio hannami]
MTTDSLTSIAQWIIQQPSLLVPEQEPVVENPFTSVKDIPSGGYEGSPKLGFIYQELCKRLFDLHPDYELVADEIQLREGKQTLGAIDFLLRRNDNVEHWEVALKFYLLKGGYWYGPDSRDRLDIKLARMLNHQLKMSETGAFQTAFPAISTTIPKLLIQGRLYQNPFSDEPVPDYCLNHPLNKDILTGFWCYQHQIDKVTEPLYKLQKIDWITGNQKQRQLLLSLPEYSIHCQSESGVFWIIVPDTWPNNH